jgi:hypothetical protein
MAVIVLDNAFEFTHVEIGNDLRAAALDCPLACE